MTTKRGKHRQAGVAMVELIVTLPMMLLLLLAVTELGRGFIEYNTLTKSVRDGARYTASEALLGTTGTVQLTPTIEAMAKNLVVYGNRFGGGTPLLPDLTTGMISVVDAGGGMIRVQADYPYTPIIGPTLPSFGIGTDKNFTFTMTAAVTMRAL